jgi:hypothetical protein
MMSMLVAGGWPTIPGTDPDSHEGTGGVRALVNDWSWWPEAASCAVKIIDFHPNCTRPHSRFPGRNDLQTAIILMRRYAPTQAESQIRFMHAAGFRPTPHPKALAMSIEADGGSAARAIQRSTGIAPLTVWFEDMIQRPERTASKVLHHTLGFCRPGDAEAMAAKIHARTHGLRPTMWELEAKEGAAAR